MDRLFENARSLLASAMALRAIGNRHHAAFLSITCLEELVKLLIHRTNGKEVFSHRKKHKYLGFFHFVMGQLQIVYMMRRAADDDMLGGTLTDRKLVFDDLSQFTGVASFDALLENVSRYEAGESFKLKIYDEKAAEIRNRTLYCDEEDGRWSDWNYLSVEDLDRYFEDALFAVALIDQIRNERFSFAAILDALPKSKDFEQPYQEMQERVRAVQKMKGNDQ
jgi:AbiV family abortive infection protein